MNLLLTCPRGVGQALKQEVRRLGYKVIETQTSYIRVETKDEKAIAHLNVWSRLANTVFLELVRGGCQNFDDYFDLIGSIDWKKYIFSGQGIKVTARSVRHLLSSERTLQGVGLKSIVHTLSGDKQWDIDDEINPIIIRIIASDDTVSVLLNTSGDPLWKRGYRHEYGEAPIKENLASFLLGSLGWKWNELLFDPCCGSGTFLIEAAMMAQNRAPGLLRGFSFESFERYDDHYLAQVKKDAIKRIYSDKHYDLYGSDISAEMINIAQKNAEYANVGDMIVWEVKNIMDIESMEGTVISNPPYNIRMGSEGSMVHLYHKLISLLQGDNMKGGFITGWLAMDSHFHMGTDWKYKKIKNGNIDCMWWKRK